MLKRTTQGVTLFLPSDIPVSRCYTKSQVLRLDRGAVTICEGLKPLWKACSMWPFSLNFCLIFDSALSMILLYQDTSLCIITFTSGHSRIWEHCPSFFYQVDTPL